LNRGERSRADRTRAAIAFALNAGFVVLCPIAARIRPFPMSVVLPEGLRIAGEILVSHGLSIDALAGPVRPLGATAKLVRAKLAALITI
jgi:mRNA interferase MazF